MNLTIQGVTDEQTTCDKCGKVELHRTCIVFDADAGIEVGRYGTSCVSTVIGRKVTGKAADSIELNRRHNLHNAKIDLANGVKYGHQDTVALAIEDIARYWIKGPEAMARLIHNMTTNPL